MFIPACQKVKITKNHEGFVASTKRKFLSHDRKKGKNREKIRVAALTYPILELLQSSFMH
jgi:hypothetical protein